MRSLVVVLSVVLCGGCAQYEAQQQAEYAARAAAIESQDDAKCQSYGTPKGSTNYSQCRMNLDNIRSQERQQAAAIYSQNIARLQEANRPAPTYNVNVCNNTPGQVNTCIYR